MEFLNFVMHRDFKSVEIEFQILEPWNLLSHKSDILAKTCRLKRPKNIAGS